MQTMKLADDLFPSLEDKRKRGTIRKGKRDVQLGACLLEASSGALLAHLVDISRVSYTTAAQLTQADADLDGYESVDQLFRDLRRFYPDLKGGDVVTVIEFGR